MNHYHNIVDGFVFLSDPEVLALVGSPKVNWFHWRGQKSNSKKTPVERLFTPRLEKMELILELNLCEGSSLVRI